MNRIKLHTVSVPNEVSLRQVHGHVVLTIPESKRHFWSPHMDVALEVDPDNGQTLVRCLIGPMPTVWTMFMFFYGFFGFMGFVGLTLGLSQWTLQNSMWGFWLIPVSLIGMAIMWFISYEGKKLAHDEMWMLKHFVDEALACDCFKMADMMEMV
ncbi:MAG: hypothetical protein R2813_08820 [Flavobacteriales bacterium]